MSALFFLMAFVNTIIDSLKDSLVITAVGGGTEVRPPLQTTAFHCSGCHYCRQDCSSSSSSP